MPFLDQMHVVSGDFAAAASNKYQMDRRSCLTVGDNRSLAFCDSAVGGQNDATIRQQTSFFIVSLCSFHVDEST
jgi:hypothetical protein